MKNKRDWVKIIAMILAILFFLLYVGTEWGARFIIEEQQKICKDELTTLHNNWLQTKTTILNCYENNLATCNYNEPNLRS